MKKTLIILFCLFIVFSLFSNEKMTGKQRCWDKESNHDSFIDFEMLMGYNPSVVQYVYGQATFNDVINARADDRGYFFSDAIYGQFFVNIFPINEVGFTVYYRWMWGLKTFVFATLFRTTALCIDIYNLTLKIAFADFGFAWYKYGFWDKLQETNNQFCFLVSPITLAINYRIRLNKHASFVIDFIGYSMQMIFNNDITFTWNPDVEASMFLEHVFSSGFGLRFYTKPLKGYLK